ncbi:hypothetical protein [Haloferax sp. DFSO60]|uniref:hypothetical protein n=1 Tax=Haloferax sp. DFSO60 TaxID=3388652 RepID=UPI00397852CD
MSHYKATFAIDSKSDLYAVQRMLEQVYDTVREESRHVEAGTDDGSKLLQEFNVLRDAVQRPSTGKLTITYERYGDELGN